MMKVRLLKILLVAFISVGTGILTKVMFSESGIVRHDVDIEKYRELGNQVDFNCVARYSSSEEASDYAAGVLIAPYWILTAAHFVEDSSLWKLGETFYKTKKVVRHPALQGATQEAQWNGRDLALIELEQPVLNIKPAIRYTLGEELGNEITKIGYGYMGNGEEGLRKPLMQDKLGGRNVVDAIGGVFENRTFSTNVLACDFDSPISKEFNKFGSAIPLDLEIGGSKGDSGGGVFMKVNGQFELVGIVSGALNREIKYGAVMSLARVSSANEWIDSIIY